ncbi:MAG: 1-acyl-sn-glycerol-3-phosphate acyltransferase [Cellvibrionaceae bacterium]|jgi:1-acyl-sn-glycerol-3-phosphate acyltransferase
MLQKISLFILRISGWTMNGRKPPEKKYMAIGYPHTSNLDGLWVVLTILSMGERPKVLIKSTLFRFPFKRLLTAVGAVPVVRGQGAKDVVQQSLEYIESVDTVSLMLSPEGSRSYTEYWKSGFYHIALAAGIPIYFCYLDYATNRLGMNSDPLYLTGDKAKDMQVIRDFYSDKNSKHPARVGPIRLKAETPTS